MVTWERSSSQLCAGFKIKRKPTPLFFTYSGEGRNMVFKKLTKPLRGWEPAHMSVNKIFKRQCEKTVITFYADSSWAELHDWRQRYMQGEVFFHSDIFVTQSFFRVTVGDRCG